jgi:hypothetical protein
MLLAFLGIVLLFAVWQWIGPALGMGGGEKVGGRDEYADLTTSVGRVPGAGRAAPERREVNEVVDLRAADLGGSARDYKPGRDPWRYKLPPPPPPPPTPPPPSKEDLEAQRLAEERLRQMRDAQAAAAAAAAAVPKPPPFTLKYMGKFGPADRPIAVFTDGKSILNVQQGEVIGGQFIVGQIGYESVEIQFVGFPNWPSQRLPIGR